MDRSPLLSLYRVLSTSIPSGKGQGGSEADPQKLFPVSRPTIGSITIPAKNNGAYGGPPRAGSYVRSVRGGARVDAGATEARMGPIRSSQEMAEMARG
jgi:hypothetical protein